jgi:hypothetical protein
MGTLAYLARNLREHLGSALREVKVAATPVPHPRAWLFLIGCYNSGTTLLASLLSNHPDIAALPDEGQFLTDQLTKDFRVGLPRMWHKREELFRLIETDTGPDPVRIKKEWGMRLDRSRPVLLEKSPPNTPRTRWLQANFENAHFVSIVRNGYAVAEGIVRKGKPHYRAEGWSISDSAQQWRRSIEIVEEDAAHLRKLIWVRYEDLARDPVPTLNRITDFVGIRPYLTEYLQSSIAVHERNESVSDLNNQSIRRLSAADIRTVNEIAADHLRRFDYPILEAEAAPQGPESVGRGTS